MYETPVVEVIRYESENIMDTVFIPISQRGADGGDACAPEDNAWDEGEENWK